MFEICIISSSDIISSGLASILAEANIPNTNIMIYDPEECIEELADENTSPSLIFADILSVNSVMIESIRNLCPDSYHISGIYFSVLPTNRTDIFDSLVSIYSDKTTIIRIVEQAKSRHKADDASTGELTPREKEIVIGVVKGFSNKEIADSLNLSIHTVMTHRRNIASKLQIHSPSGLTIYAIVSKLVSIDDIKSEMLK